ncbi:MAG TPA: alpha/beta hydrolase [Candidatus Dormibacteraeota bacterium]|nr:alpha/beta hydrolase [Candidatus Dormibacteraeota bacterium]
MAQRFPSFESKTLTIDGVNLHYLCGGSGPPLVLVHGLGSSAAVEFYHNLEPLAAHHRVFAVDLPGFGRSDKPALEYTIGLFVKAVKDLMASEGVERAAVIGVSMGGRVALGLALESPEKVERLVLVDALGVGTPRRVLAYRILLTRGLGELTLRGTARALRRMNPATIRRFWGWYLQRPNRVNTLWTDERIANHGTLLASPEYRAAYLSALRSISGMRQLRDGVAVENRLPELRMPTLLIWGRHDHIFPASHAEAARNRIPNGRVEIFDDSGHTPQMEEPDRFNRLVLDFLREPASGRGEGAA